MTTAVSGTIAALLCCTFFGEPAHADLTTSAPAVSFPTNPRTGVGAGQQTRGFTFTLDDARTLTHLGMLNYNFTGMSDSDRRIGVWDEAGNLVADETILAGPTAELDVAGNFLYVPLAEPIVLDAGETYTAGVHYSVNNSPGLAFGLEVSTLDGFNYRATAETGPPGGAFAKPTIIRSDRPNGYFGPNLRFDLALPSLPDFRITDVSSEGETVTLTWNSKPGKTYALFYSTDLVDFGADIDDDVRAETHDEVLDDGDKITVSFPNPTISVDLPAGEPTLFFRVEQLALNQ